MTKRPKSETLEDLLYREFPVRDGYVIPIDYIGTEASILRAARVSYGNTELKEELSHKDKNLLRFLLRNQHSSPFEQCSIAFCIRLPIEVWRQQERHRSARYSHVNEFSTRYKEIEFEQQLNDRADFRFDREVVEADRELAEDSEYRTFQFANQIYKELRALGVVKEQARRVLPLGTFTEVVWQIDLWNLLNFLRLRLKENAQKEIRDYAKTIANIVQAWVPNVYLAFEDYVLHAVTLTLQDIVVLQQASMFGLEKAKQGYPFAAMSQTEQKECLEKLDMLNETQTLFKA